MSERFCSAGGRFSVLRGFQPQFSSAFVNITVRPFGSLPPIRKAPFKPLLVLLGGYLACGAAVALGDGGVSPRPKIAFLDLPRLHPCGVALVVAAVERQSLIAGGSELIFLARSQLLTGSRFAVGNSVAVIRVVIAFHDEIFSASLAFFESDVVFEHFRELKFQNLRGRAELI